MRVAIIGGGPSGLVQLKVLLEAHQRFPIAPFECKLFESYSKIGGIFFHHSYEDGELVSSKFLTSFSDFRPRADDPDFLSAERYVEYLEEYASHFQLWPHINLSTTVKSVRRGDNGGHVVTYQAEDGEEIEWECDALAVCSGVHKNPHVPDIPGIDRVPVVMHSSKFKTREQFGKDSTVLILGSGETGADLSYLAVTSDTKRVVLCHKDGWIGAPKRLPGQKFLPWLFGDEDYPYPQLPVDVAQSTLFDTMYVHPMVRDSMIVWNFYHVVALPAGTWLNSGSPHGVDQWVGQIYGERFDVSRVFFNKAWQRIQHYVSYPYRPTTWSLPVRIRKFFYNTRLPPPPTRIIDVAPFPSHISEDGVAHFPRTGRPEAERIQDIVVKPDVVIFATGYLTSFPFLQTPDNDGRKPYPTAFDADVRQIWKSDDPTVGFIGFIRPGFGAIPPLAELQSMLFTMNLINRIPRPLNPDDEWHYRIIHQPDARVTYGVEHDSYAYQLAKDIDGAPSFTEVLRIGLTTWRPWRLPFIWAAGGALNAKFRLRGPWMWEGAKDSLTYELWETIERSEGMFSNMNMRVVPMIYLGSINLYYCIYSGFWGLLAKLRLAKPIQHRIEPKLIVEQLQRRHEMEKAKMASKA
ncbi:hypothetical protein BGZ63DRAFT_383591 [Mariannaea sp. PMI_226]|nr:hypothetical protein BGZ63DRAFT_383591 [Mariannaea sp. PMI_226]